LINLSLYLYHYVTGGKAMGGMDGGIRVPTAAMFPGRLPAGRVIEQPTSQMDVFTTVSALLDTTPPKDRQIDGVNIWPLLMGQDTSRPHEFLFHYCGTEIHAARYSPLDGNKFYDNLLSSSFKMFLQPNN
jgi:arylsulfatase A-like enzyme